LDVSYGQQVEEEEDIWYQKDKLFKVGTDCESFHLINVTHSKLHIKAQLKTKIPAKHENKQNPFAIPNLHPNPSLTFPLSHFGLEIIASDCIVPLEA
jgi:hypothetical protein